MAIKNNLELIDYLKRRIIECDIQIYTATFSYNTEVQVDYRIRRSVYYEILKLIKED